MDVQLTEQDIPTLQAELAKCNSMRAKQPILSILNRFALLNKQAELVTMPDSKGENVKVVKVKSLMPVELNSANAGAFNQQAHIAKSKVMTQTPQENGGGERPEKVMQGGFEYTWNPTTGKYE